MEGVEEFEDGERLGWCVHIQPTTVTDPETKNLLAAVDVYLLSQEGTPFRATKRYQPYFYVICKEHSEREVSVGLKGAFNTLLTDVRTVEKEDLELPNHLSGLKRTLLKLLFANVSDLCTLRDVIKQAVVKNQAVEAEALDIGSERLHADPLDRLSFLNFITDIKEFDVKYHVRVAIDLELRVGLWYKVQATHGQLTFSPGGDLINPVPKICAFDIECSKAPLKFPDAQVDPVYMISYMLDTQGYLLINREIVTEDIFDFEYTPKPEYEGPFIVFNEPDEEAMLKRWFAELKAHRPDVFVTFNGDFFDMPFLATRAGIYGLDMKAELGFSEGDEGEWRSPCRPHIDCLYWVKRDSYLPQGSQGLKAVTKAKLGYDPLEINPEDMLKFAQEQPQRMASYSVSDAVATYYLYMKYIHPFIFSLCTIIPMPPDEVLRKGSGTCCETLLMVQAYQKNIVFPNKQVEQREKFYNNHLLESETYIGGHVDAIRSGVFRADHLQKFQLNPSTFQTLIDRVDNALKFAIEVEGGLKMEEVTNYAEVRGDIVKRLESLRDTPFRQERPLIYHLDVGAMYPNIILTNRLQPPSMVHEQECAACVYNRPENRCQRRMQWMWRGEYFTANKSEYMRVKQQLETERFQPSVLEAVDKGNVKKKGRQSALPGKKSKEPWRSKRPSLLDRLGNGARGWSKKEFVRKLEKRFAPAEEEEDPSRPKRFHELTPEVQFQLIKKRLGEYSRKAYKKTHNTKEVKVDATVCQRENPFFVDTVRAFRDRRYVYKGLTKQWCTELAKAKDGKSEFSLRECQSRAILYESLQLAHKCILNSFYGYVMRRGSRWYSMEMGGVVTHLGANIIKMARELVDNIGLALELDTDGIWCCLPATFPENYTLTTTHPKKAKYNISYPCVMLNEDVNKQFTNHQYQDWDAEKGEWVTRSECSIFFEVDGPYLAMILPASREEGKSIKKRYAVFHHDKSLAELKGFEIKRRGELKLIKVFQAQVFPKFVEGATLQECYDAVAKVANDHLDILYSKGAGLDTEELMDLIVESRTMSSALADYGATQKSLPLTTARRLAEFLGPQMVKDKGLSCSYVIAKRPETEPVTARAVPVAIFSAEVNIRQHFLSRWLKDSSLPDDVDVRDILDWNYYIERLGSAIQKIITIPAAFQGIANPVPRVEHPAWLGKDVAKELSRFKQNKIDRVFVPQPKAERLAGAEEEKEDVAPPPDIEDIEDGPGPAKTKGPVKATVWGAKSKRRREEEAPAPEAPPQVSAAFTNKYFGARTLHPLDASFFRSPDFVPWLTQQKQHWRQRVRERKMLHTGELPVDKRTHTVAANREGERPARDVALALTGPRAWLAAATWEVLEVRAAPDLPAGVLKAFVLIDGKSVQTVRIQVPRLVYVNSRQAWDAAQIGARPVNYTLPRRKAVHHLYELEFEEEKYNSEHVSNLSLMSEVEGVYERNVTPLFRAILRLGCVCTVNKPEYTRRLAADRQSNADIFRLGELDLVGTPSKPYLQNHQLHTLYLYHSFADTDSRGIICLFLTRQKQVRTAVLQPARANRQSAADWSRLTQQAMSRTQAEASQWPDSDSQRLGAELQLDAFEFLPPEYVDSKAAAYRRADGWLMEFLSLARPTLVFLQGSSDLPIQQQLPMLSNVPVKILQPQKGDHDLYRHANVFNVFTSAVMERIIEHFGTLMRGVEECIRMARYSNVPLCNLDNDMAVGVIDVTFGRLLRNNSHLLWCTAGARPDLGGAEGDDNKFTTCEEVLASLQPVDFNSPGAHLTYSVNLDLSHLEVIAVIYSQAIMETDLHALQLQQESAQVLSAFNIMREMVSLWYADALSGADFAVAPDHLLQHLFRWLKTRSSLLYDPALYRFCMQLVKKAFTALLQRMLKVGSRIVFANFQRIIINTPKASAHEAQLYVNFLLSAVRDNALLQRLTILPSAYYSTLLWMDRMNHVVFHWQPEGGAATATTEGPFVPAAVLALGAYFPQETGKRLQDNVVRFLAALTNFKAELLRAEHAKPEAEQAGRDTLLKECERFAISFVSENLQQRLMSDVEKMTKFTAARHAMPKRPGSASLTTDCPLEYVKAVCHLLQLYAPLNNTVTTMKTNLLKLVGVKPFDAPAQFRDPAAAALVLSDVMCSCCNEVMDVDLVRDENFAPDKEWACLVCHKPFNRDLIEAQLVDQLGLLVMAYQVQDLQCVKCKQVKADFMLTYCSCSGEYKPKTKP
eukprot:EG_transcript_101